MHVFVSVHVVNSPRPTSLSQEQSVGKNSILMVCKKLVSVTSHSRFLLHVADLPRVTTHPQEVKDAVQGQPVTFTAEATGTQPLKYQWEWKPPKKRGRSGKWQPCRAEWCHGATLTIPKVEKSHSGSYRCVISNEVGSQTFNPANLRVGKHCLKLAHKVLHYTHLMIFFLCVGEPSKVTTPAKLSIGKS